MRQRIVFQEYKGRATVAFTCPRCRKNNRKRTFTVHHTVNPFNKNEDGTVKNDLEVRQGAIAEAQLRRDQFMTEPLCAACEEPLTYKERQELGERRRGGIHEVVRHNQ
jgi:hypothetical protein